MSTTFSQFQISSKLREKLKRTPTKASSGTGLYIEAADGKHPQATSYSDVPVTLDYRREVILDGPFVYYWFDEPIEDVIVVNAVDDGDEQGMYDPSRAITDGALADVDSAAVRSTVDGTVTTSISPTSPGCVEFWLRTTDDGPHVLVRVTNSPGAYVGGDQELTITLNSDGTLTVDVVDVVPTPTFLLNVSSSVLVNDGEWHHVVANDGFVDPAIYVDGVNVS